MDNTNSLKAVVGISAIASGCSVGIVAFFAIFAPQQLAAAAWMVAPLCLMGIALGFLAARQTS